MGLNFPDITVVLTTRDRASLVRDTLESIRSQATVGLSVQVVVVDNGSTDETPSVLAHFADHPGVLVLSEPVPGKNKALNTALPHIDGDLVVFTDDDIVPGPDWLAEFHGVANRWPEAGIFGGRITPLFPPGSPQWAMVGPHAETAYCLFDPASEEGPTSLLPFGGNFAVRRSLLAGMSFNEGIGPREREYAMGSETEMLQRLRGDGAIVVFSPKVHVHHRIRKGQLTFSWLFGRAFKSGRGRCRLGELRDVESTQLLGAPRWLWRAVFVAFLRYSVSFLSGPTTRLRTGWRFHFLRGILRESRELTLSEKQGVGNH